MRALALAAVLPLAMALGWAHGSQVASEERGDPSRLWAEEPRWVLLALRLSEWNTLPYVEPDRPCSFLVGQASSMDKVFREAADFRGPFSSQVEIAAAGRERESFQLVLLPVGEALRAVEVDISDLLHEDGRTRLPATCVTWHPVGYVQTKPSASAIRRVGWWWPDILLPAEPFDVELGFVQPVWFTVEVPDRARAGTYHGLIKLNPAGIEPRVVGLELTVRSFSLPLRGKLKTAFSFNPGMWAMWYHPEEVKRHLGMGDEAEWGTVHELNSSWECAHLMPGEKWREVYGFLLAHRLNPTTIYAHLEDGRAWVVPGREDMEYCYERGMNATCLAHVEARFVPSDPEEAAEYLRTLDAWLADWQSFIEEKGWQDFTWYVHGFDESDWRQDPETTTDPWIRRIYGGIGATFPQIKRESANPLNPLHIGLFDIWTPQTGQWKPEWEELVRERREAGEEVWAYVASAPVKPYANFFIDFPGVDPRVLPWQLYQHRVTGFLYWQINCYYPGQENWNRAGPKWPDRPWNPLSVGTNSDGILIYPGPDGTPLASTRLANLRDGIEDYEALAMLEELTEALEAAGGNQELVTRARQALAVGPEVSRSWTEYTQDPAVITQRRGGVDELIKAAIQALTGSAEHGRAEGARSQPEHETRR